MSVRSPLIFEDIVEGLPDAIFVVDPTLYVVYANATARGLCGLDPEGFDLGLEAAFCRVFTPKESEAAVALVASLFALPVSRHEGLTLGTKRQFRGRVRRTGAVVIIELSAVAGEEALEATRREAHTRRLRYNAAVARLVRSGALREGRLADAAVEVTRMLADTVECARVGLWWLATDPVRLECATNYDRGHERHSVAAPLLADEYPRYFQALRSGDAVVAEFAQSDPRTREFTDTYLVPIGISSMLDVPVFAGGQLVGVLCLEHVGPPRAFTLDEQQLASLAASFLSLTRETADRLAAQRQLEESRVFLDSIVENLPLMVFVKDAAQLRFLRFNRAGEQLLGLDRTQLLGKSDRDFFPPDQAEFFVRRDREVLASTEPIDIPEEPILTAHNGQRLLHTRKIAIRDEEGTARYLLGISEDITDRVRPPIGRGPTPRRRDEPAPDRSDG